MQNKLLIITSFLTISFLTSTMSFAEPSLFSLDGKWADQNGKDFKFSDLKGKTTVLSMVYTTCDYSCPLITRKLKSIYKNVNSNLRPKVQFLLITFDPARDTSKKLKEYGVSQKLDERNFSLLTSSEQNTHALSVALNFQYKKMSNGHFSHSNQITVLDKNGVITHQQDISKKIDSILKIIEKENKSS